MTGDFSTEKPPTRQWGPGWYPDHDNGGERWWDGQAWDCARWRPGGEDSDELGPDSPSGCGGPSESPVSPI